MNWWSRGVGRGVSAITQTIGPRANRRDTSSRTQRRLDCSRTSGRWT